MEKINFLYQSFKNIIGKNRYSYLIKYIKEYKCKNIIEVGVWNGENSKKMLNAATLNQQSNDEINYWGFDLWEEMDDAIYQKEYSKKPPKMHDVRRNLESTGCNINLIKGDTKITLKKFYNIAKKKIFPI